MRVIQYTATLTAPLRRKERLITSLLSCVAGLSRHWYVLINAVLIQQKLPDNIIKE